MQNLSQEDQAVLTHCIVDPQAWIDNAIANNLEFAIQEKINKYRQEYFDAKYLSITIDPETNLETRIENLDYLNRAERDALEEEKRSPLYGKTPAEIFEIKKAQMSSMIQSLLDSTAKTRNYDGILSACTYATSSNAQFQAEGQACVLWRDAVWGTCYQIMADIASGVRTEPTVEELLIELPQIVW